MKEHLYFCSYTVVYISPNRWISLYWADEAEELKCLRRFHIDSVHTAGSADSHQEEGHLCKSPSKLTPQSLHQRGQISVRHIKNKNTLVVSPYGRPNQNLQIKWCFRSSKHFSSDSVSPQCVQLQSQQILPQLHSSVWHWTFTKPFTNVISHPT